MNSKKNEIDDETVTVLASGTMFKGDFESEGDVRVIGAFEGNLRCYRLMIDEDGDVQGKVDAETVSSSGRLVGQVTANKIFATATSTLEGKFMAVEYGLEPGAKIRKAELDSPDDEVMASTGANARRYPRVVQSHRTADQRGASDSASRPSASSSEDLSRVTGD
ncbi:polymer-forming cytoskeletal protein [Salipiger sp. PrR003]|uniref:bactofilin family protein n=1 Tax=Salipiger sp. PrR003 TaxID=2706776 RepID=UPI0013DC5299|nr:polymer-forming cytoskeletal protein [Salipiger sp. PrR003]NDV52831.1 polymer-forming cytoskeletal protein [Salipiger sp. PrR003]